MSSSPPPSKSHPLARTSVNLAAAALIGICTGGILFLQARASLYLLDGSTRLIPTWTLTTLGAYLAGATLVLARGGSSGPASSTGLAAARAWTGPAIYMAIAVSLAFTLPLLARRGDGPSQIANLLLGLAGLCAFLLPLGVSATERPSSPSRPRLALFLSVAFVALGVGAWLIPHLSPEELSIRQGTAGFAAVGLLAPGLLLFTWNAPRWVRPLTLGVWIAVASQTVIHSFRLLDRFYETLSLHEKLPPPQRFARIVENDWGVLTLHPAGILRLNGIYQGTTNISPHPQLDLNRSRRAYLLPSVVKSTKRVLFLGLGSGAWVQILAHHPVIESIVVLEDNPAFPFLMKNSGTVASALQNPKVKVELGNIENLLTKQGKFDVVVQDQIAFRTPPPHRYLTVDHWENVRTHLTERGAVYVNTHEIPQAEKAVLEVFPHALKYQDMLFGSNVPLGIRGYDWMDRLAEFRIDGRPVLPPDEAPAIAHKIVMNRDWKTGFAWQKNEELRQRLAQVRPWSESDVRRTWLPLP